jgi:hypothetical protein
MDNILSHHNNNNNKEAKFLSPRIERDISPLKKKQHQEKGAREKYINIIHYFIVTKNINKRTLKKRSYQIHNLIIEILQVVKTVSMVIDSHHFSSSCNSNSIKLG